MPNAFGGDTDDEVDEDELDLLPNDVAACTDVAAAGEDDGDDDSDDGELLRGRSYVVDCVYSARQFELVLWPKSVAIWLR